MNDRSANMRANKSKNTSPELRVRRALHALGLRYRLHDKKLPGKPDVVLRSRRTVVEVRGCYWHGHEGCKLASAPARNTEYWGPKLARTRQRDADNEAALTAAGWRVVVIWECATRDPARLAAAAQEVADIPRGALKRISRPR